LKRTITTKRKTCYYKVLGINVRASREEIRSAFRYLAMKWHPDRNPGNPKASERFREVLTAYETLINPAMRGRYDRMHGYREPRKGSQTSWTDLHAEDSGEATTFDEIFQDVFGMGRPKVRTQHGSDLRFDIQIPRSSVANGHHEEISYERLIFCRKCKEIGSRRLECGQCGGTGEFIEPCSLRVWIPPGIGNGTRIRVAGAGDMPFAAVPPGDLILLVYVVENC